MDCQQCNGSGEVLDPNCYINGEESLHWIICPDCEGTGLQKE